MALKFASSSRVLFNECVKMMQAAKYDCKNELLELIVSINAEAMILL